MLQFDWIIQILLYASLKSCFQSEILLCVFTYARLSIWLLFQGEVRGKQSFLICQFTFWNFLNGNSCENSISHLGPLFSISVWCLCNQDEGRWSACLSSEKIIPNHCALIDFYCLIGDRQVCPIFVGFPSEVKPKNVLEVIWSKYILVLCYLERDKAYLMNWQTSLRVDNLERCILNEVWSLEF